MDKTTLMTSLSDIIILSAKHLLEDNGIESFVFNRKDSAYAGLIGEIELHVRLKDQVKAKEILIEAGIMEKE